MGKKCFIINWKNSITTFNNQKVIHIMTFAFNVFFTTLENANKKVQSSLSNSPTLTVVDIFVCRYRPDDTCSVNFYPFQMLIACGLLQQSK